ncbi:protein of unknown function [Methylocella tundrae]|uniref:Uncharacterized protein n=1 Tax=Methylocella tundrae TaxID=227605 RepID=A0A4U8Z131_METTU|nr:protein of unknown function [Methylocella tundrae]
MALSFLVRRTLVRSPRGNWIVATLSLGPSLDLNRYWQSQSASLRSWLALRLFAASGFCVR